MRTGIKDSCTEEKRHSARVGATGKTGHLAGAAKGRPRTPSDGGIRERPFWNAGGSAQDEAQRRRCIANITAQTDHITWLVRSLLALAEIDAGVLVLKKEEAGVKDLIDEIVSGIAIEADIKDVRIELDIPSGNALVCDRRWTLEALSNIIKNSLQHTEAGGKIKISSEETNLSVNIRIEDDGCGISKKDLPNIFERFYHGGKSDPNSNGIGLSLSKQIINSQNGTISCESEEGKGTIFEIKIYKSATV